MKAFDLEEARKGAKVCTRDGDDVRIICFDRKHEDFPIVALLKSVDGGGEFVEMYTIDGYFDECKTSDGMDLMMVDKMEVLVMNKEEIVAKIEQWKASAESEVIEWTEIIEQVSVTSCKEKGLTKVVELKARAEALEHVLILLNSMS